MTLEEIKQKRYRCMDICPTWNREDRDCEIFGYMHPAPSKCPYMAQNCKEEQTSKEQK